MGMGWYGSQTLRKSRLPTDTSNTVTPRMATVMRAVASFCESEWQARRLSLAAQEVSATQTATETVSSRGDYDANFALQDQRSFQ